MNRDPKAIPYQLQNLYYQSLKENPSYGSQMPNDFPYDPGATGSVFELGYVPTGSSIIPIVLILAIAVSLSVWALKHKMGFAVFTHTALSVALCAVILGPLTIPSLIVAQTTIGVGKIVAVGTLVIMYTVWFIRSRQLPAPRYAALIPIFLYLLSLFTALPFVTNPDFFAEDLKLIIGGLLFYFFAYAAVDTRQLKNMAMVITVTLVAPAALIFLVALFKDFGVSLITNLYPRYENIVFQFDLTRGRILSIVDMEFFIPILLYLVFYVKKWRRAAAGILTMVSFAVFATNYRYRFLTYVVGFVGYVYLIPKYVRKSLLKAGVAVFILAFGSYFAFSAATGRITIIDRFLLENYANDVDSLRRRLVMANQALEVFSQFPVFGVGLGNYKDNVQIVYESFGGRFYEPYYKILQNVYAYPHNWFLLVLAEQGAIGLIVLFYLLYTFARTDISLYKRLSGEVKGQFVAISLVSWLYVFANQFTPLNNSAPMVIVFWTMRGIIAKLNEESRIRGEGA